MKAQNPNLESKTNPELKNGKDSSRMVSLDLLRILACFSVIVVHAAAQFWYTLPVTGADWQIADAYNAVSRFGVPVFAMISGALFLAPGKEISLKKLYTHNILRLVIIYLVWTCLYAAFDCRNVPAYQLDKQAILMEIYGSKYHLWYLPMAAGLYILLPVLRSWVEKAEKKNLQYFLVLFLVFQVGKETTMALRHTNGMEFFWKLADIYMVCGYLGYFVLGHYLLRFGLGKKWRRLVYAGGILGVFANIILGSLLSLRAGTPSAAIYDSFGFFTFLISAALFQFFTEKVEAIRFSPLARRLIRQVSLSTLGIYLMHLGLLEFLFPLGIHSMSFTPILCIPLFSLFCFAVCLVLSALLRRIPFIGRFLC